MLVEAHGSIDTGGLSRDPREEAVRQVLELIAQGGEPSPRTLDVSPYLADWSWRPHPVKGVEVLWGDVAGHARLGSGMIYTGRVWAMAVDRSWVLTTSRFYRLGPSADR